VGREVAPGRLELVDRSHGFIRVESDVIRASVVGKGELTPEVGTCPLVIEGVVESPFEKQILHISLAHIIVNLFGNSA